MSGAGRHARGGGRGSGPGPRPEGVELRLGLRHGGLEEAELAQLRDAVVRVRVYRVEPPAVRGSTRGLRAMSRGAE